MIAYSVAHLTSNARVCRHCGGIGQLQDGGCVSCLLQGGLFVAAIAAAEAETSFEELLAAIDIRDSDWRLGNYQILEEIGRGGMGVIYRARQRHSKRIVALKRLLSYHGESRDTLERFRREAEAAASLDHPNILPIYDVGEADGLPYFTMKLAVSGNLQQLARRLRPTPRECVRLVMKVTRAVSYAHREGILHRDLKPGNILLDARGEPLVSDFGLAKWLDRPTDLTRTLTVFGTPGYIAPEQARSCATALTPAADVYSIGAILFDLLAGRPPFLGEHALAVIKQADEKPVPKLRSLVRSADRDLETICAKCLQREAKLRYRSASDLAEDLQRWLEGRSILARRVSAPVQVWRWTKRRPYIAAGIAATVMLATTAIWNEVRNYQLAQSVNASAAAQHSIMIEPVLAIDDVIRDEQLSGKLARAMAEEFRQLGPGLIEPAGGTSDFHPRARLCSTIRRSNGDTRVAIRLIDSTSEALLLRDAIEVRTPSAVPTAVSHQLARRIYRILDADKLKELAEADPGKQVAAAAEFLAAARDLLDRRTLVDLERAEQCVRHALQLAPDSATAFAYLATVYGGRASLGSDPAFLDQARAAAQRAVTLDEDNAEAHRAAAAVEILSGRSFEALEHCYREIELSGVGKRSSSMIGQAYRDLGRPDKALAWYNIGAAYDVRPGESAHVAGDCWCYLADDQRAAEAYERCAALQPGHPEGWIGLCHLRLLQGDFAGAIQICDRNSQHYSEHPYAKQMAALVAFFSRNYVDAERLYEELLRAEPSGGGYFYGNVSYDSAMARIQLEKGGTKAAVGLLSQARQHAMRRLSGSPRNAAAQYELAAVEACAGHAETAIKQLQAAADARWLDYRSLRLDPRFDQIRSRPDFNELVTLVESRVANLRALALRQ